ncbi:MAG: GNAT family protein [Candidatus Paceibacterota bacterium]|jgi:RimJ/RimL family protein N-acetyltransferase
MIEINEIKFDDLSFLNEVRNECCEEYLHDSDKYTLKQTIDWFNKTKPMFWMIKFLGENVGYFRTSNYSIKNKNIYIGADLHKDYRGMGIAYASYCIFIPILFNKLNLHKISLEVLETNIRAISLYKKIGFIIEGIKREEVQKNGVWVNSIIMSILREEF